MDVFQLLRDAGISPRYINRIHRQRIPFSCIYHGADVPKQIKWLIKLAFKKILNALLSALYFVITVDVTVIWYCIAIICSQYRRDFGIFYERLRFTKQIISPHAFVFGSYCEQKKIQFVIALITFFIKQSLQNMVKRKYKQLSELLIDGYMRTMIPLVIPNVINPLIPLNFISRQFYYQHCICLCGKYIIQCECDPTY